MPVFRLRLFVFLILLCCNYVIFALNYDVRGVVYDDGGEALPGAVVTVSRDDSTIIKCVVAASDGTFDITVDSSVTSISVEVGFLGFKTESRKIDLPYDGLLRFDLVQDAILLKEVHVVAKPIRAQGDTLIYNVASFKSKSDRSIEDVIKRMPGITVHGDGRISYQGKPIRNFYIEGLDMLQGNYTLATRNISADDIATVDVYENHQPIKVLENLELSDKAALNLSLKKKRMMRPVGRLSGGGGIGEDYGLWLGELMSLMVSPSLQLLAVAKSTNTGAVYREEVKNHLDAVALKNTIAYSVFTDQLASTPAIERKRYDYNRSELVSGNGLRRLGKAGTIGINASYDCDRGDTDGRDVITYYRQNEEPVVVDNHIMSRLRKRTAKVGTAINLNKSGFYLADKLSFSGLFRDNVYAVRGTNEVNQILNVDEIRLSNSMSVALRHGGRVWQFYSDFFYMRTPDGGITVSPLNMSERGFNQYASGTYLYNNERSSIAWLIGSHVTLGADLSFSFMREAFKSRIDPEMEENGIRLGYNNVSFSNVSAVVRPFFIWQNNSLYFKLYTQLALYDLKIFDNLIASENNFVRFYPGFNISLNYKINHEFRANIDGGFRQSTGGLRNFITGPVYTNYRMLSALGSGRLGCSRLLFADAGMAYREVVHAVFASLKAKISRNYYNSIGFTDVSDSQTVGGMLYGDSHNDNAGLDFAFSKRFIPINLTAKIDASWDVSRNYSVRDGVDLHSDLSNWILKGDVSGSWFSDRLVAGLACSYSKVTQRIDSNSARSDIDQFAMSAHLSVFPHEFVELFGKLSMQSCNFSHDTHVNQIFVDAGARYRRERWELELRLNNLSGQKTYSYSVFDGPDCISYKCRLRPFEAFAILRVLY